MDGVRGGLRLAAALSGVAVGATVATGVQAQDGWLDGFDWSGFLRVESAYKATSDENPYNQRGNLFNGVPTERNSGVPPSEDVLVTDTATREVPRVDNDFNLLYLRGRLDFGYKMGDNLALVASVRGIYDPIIYEEYDPGSVDSQAVGDFNQEPNYFEYAIEGGGRANPLEWAARDYMVDIPALYLDYQNGPLLIRAGNQQIAWGQALFFRVLDVPNGLDYRRHSILDFASEEYSDKRVPALGIRTAYQINEDWELDAFGQKFQPTVYGNPNTPYNVIASQFTVRDFYSDYEDEINYGIRARGRLGVFGVQGIFVDRYNPDGVFRWTASGVDRNLPGTLPNPLGGTLGALPNVNALLNDTLFQGLAGLGGVPGTGAILAQTPFEADPSGVITAQEWFTYAAMARLDTVEALNAAIRDYPASQMLGASEVESEEAARRELDLFFQLSGGLRGHIAREYFREKIYGLGMSYVTEGELGSILDQLIINVEATYTPDRHFTNRSLGRDYIVEDEWMAALVMEKYQRFTRAFPATYFVFQYLHKSESDLFGRHLSGFGGSPEHAASTGGGIDHGSNYLVFAFQQPFPSLVWRADFALLYDVEGGLLVQPALRWKPNGDFTVEAFFNYIDTVHGNPNKNALSTADWVDEVAVRISYQF
ncbi:MAG: DUF1302 family protein [Gammaproteobacteria bacterium]